MIDKLIRLFTFVFLLLLPIYFLPFANSSVESDKQALLIFSALILSATYVLKVLQEKRFVFERTPIDFLLLFWAASYTVSTFLFSPNKIGAFTAPLGTGTLIAAILLYFVLSQIKINLFPLLISASIVSLFTIANQFKFLTNLDPNGNTLHNFVFLAIITVYLAGKLIIFLNSDSRKKAADKKNLPFIVDLVMLLIILSALSISGYHLITDSKPLLLSFSYGWVIMMESFKNIGNFLLGVGPANFSFAYSLGKPAVINQTPFWNLALNSSSSYFLTLATEAGIISVILFALTLFKSLKFSHNQPGEEKPYFFALLAALLIHLVIPTNTVLLAVAIIFLAVSSPKWKTKEKTLPQWTSYILGAVIISLAFLAFWEGKVYLGSIYFRKSVNEANTGKNLGSAYKYAQMARNSDPSNESYYGLSSNLALVLAQNLAQNKEATDSAKNISILTQQAVDNARAATALNSLNAQNWGLLASVYQSLNGMVQGAEQLTLDAYSKQMSLDPQNPLPKVGAAGFLMSVKNQDQSAQLDQLNQAYSLLNQAISLKPDWNNAHYNLAMLFSLTKKYKEAAAEMQKTLDLTSSDAEDYKKVQQELEQLKALIPKEATPSTTSSAKQGQTLK